ncbi:MAG: hypothetical protein NXH82_14350 [Rhodobacteraceae bacterium]|nr:hypothetical protein [Paracoccaceae bacterium]
MKLTLTTALTTALLASHALAGSMGSDDTAAYGVDDKGDITASRGADNPTAGDLMADDETSDLDLTAGSTNRSAGADDTATMGVDDKGDITASRGADNPSAADLSTGS